MEIGEVIDKKLKAIELKKALQNTEFSKQNTENRIQNSNDKINVKESVDQLDEIENLTFIDGVLLTWDIFNKILNKHLRDENGELEKDRNGCSYLGIINDDITEFLLNNVLENGYFKAHGKHLCDLFEIIHCQYTS